MKAGNGHSQQMGRKKKPLRAALLKPRLRSADTAVASTPQLEQGELTEERSPQEVTRDENGELIFHLGASEKLAKSFATANRDLGVVLLQQVSGALPFGSDATDPKRWNFALELMGVLEPRDGLEALLCSQCVGLHSLGMECLRRAAADQTSEGVDQNVNRATRLLRTFATVAETLRTHRGGGQQKMIVEHVTVNAGGQAVVGNVNSTGGDGDEKKDRE
jgi:hypothetical protein